MTRRLVAAAAIAFLVLAGTTAARPADFCDRKPEHPKCQTPSPTASPTLTPTSAPTATPTPSPTPTPPSTSRLLFGLGPVVDSARNARLTREAPVKLMTVWWNGTTDANGWLTDAYHQGMYDEQYALGRSVQVIAWSDVPETTISTAYGTACGRPYPLSGQWMADLDRVVNAVSGSGQLYVTLFTEFQTFACSDNAWNPNPQTNAYWRALKDRYLTAVDRIHSLNPSAKVCLGWGGWQTRWDDPAIGGGRSMFGYFADVMAASDHQCFQAMQSDGNVGDVKAMHDRLDDFGKVLLAHYKPDNGSQATFSADVRAMLTDSYLATVPNLFGWAFMDQANLSVESDYQFVRDAVIRYGGP